ncbi:TRAP transporter substrate-binding protein [Salinarimonas soli]|nr:TRAP transporter substrate-binding protein [Salinarimonas soli]
MRGDEEGAEHPARPPSRRGVLAGGAAFAAAGLLARPARAAVRLRLAHGLPRAHPVHRAMLHFADLVSERSGGEITVTLYADGVLGEEPTLLDQVRTGTLDMTKASASVLDVVSPLYRLFDIPFLLRDKEHWRKVVSGAPGERILQAPGPSGMTGLCFYDAGARSFYGRRPIARPEDLAGLKIRVQPSPTMVRMVQTLGAEAVPLPWGVVYTALQTGLIDGAENNLTALIYGRHAEVTRHYAYTEHTMVPDVLLIGARTWAALRPPLRDIVRAAAAESAMLQSALWANAEEASRAGAERLGVVFSYPDKAPFIARLSAMRREFMTDPTLAPLIAQVEGA